MRTCNWFRSELYFNITFTHILILWLKLRNFGALIWAKSGVDEISHISQVFQIVVRQWVRESVTDKVCQWMMGLGSNKKSLFECVLCNKGSAESVFTFRSCRACVWVGFGKTSDEVSISRMRWGIPTCDWVFVSSMQGEKLSSKIYECVLQMCIPTLAKQLNLNNGSLILQ